MASEKAGHCPAFVFVEQASSPNSPGSSAFDAATLLSRLLSVAVARGASLACYASMMSKPFPPPDPVVEAYKEDVDISLLRRNLQRTVQERLDALISMLELSEEMRRGVDAARSRDEVR